MSPIYCSKKNQLSSNKTWLFYFTSFFCYFSEEKKLSKYVSHRIQGNNVTLTVVFPEEGQYGMDIYTREVANTNGNGNVVDHDSEKHLLTHCCKYLINFSTQARR